MELIQTGSSSQQGQLCETGYFMFKIYNNGVSGTHIGSTEELEAMVIRFGL